MFRFQSLLKTGLLSTFGGLATTTSLACTANDSHPTAVPSATATRPLVTPTPVEWVQATPDDELAVVVLIDVTSSAIRFADEANAKVADGLPGLLRTGHGGTQFMLNTISANSFDPANGRLAFLVPGLPAQPVLGQAMARPAEPNLAECQQNPFKRTACEAELLAGYQGGASLGYRR